MAVAKPPIDEEVASLLEFMDDSACRTRTPGLWDTYLSNNRAIKPALKDDPGSNDRAKEICLGCPVMMQCLRHGVRFRKRDAIYGGLDDHERDAWAARELSISAA